MSGDGYLTGDALIEELRVMCSRTCDDAIREIKRLRVEVAEHLSALGEEVEKVGALRAELQNCRNKLKASGRMKLREELAANRGDLILEAQRALDAEAARDRLRELYEELIYAVGNKYEGESRHQTALRYIKRAEEVVERPAQAALKEES